MYKKIRNHFENGGSVLIRNARMATKYSPKHSEMIRLRGDDLYVQSGNKWLCLFGCKIDFLMGYLESKFTSGMTWKNHKLYGWHIDHIIPLSSFDLTDRDQYLKACHYTNLQPLWAVDNIRKGNKLK